MAFTGNLAEFPLPKIFQFLEQGNNTGLLTIRILAADLTAVVQVHYIWLHQGRIVAAGDRLDEKGLLSMIAQRGWVSEDVALRMAQICPVNTPIGLCLKFQGLLQAEQLKLLFRIQVVEQVSALFELKDGQFEFDAKATLPLAEMTGMSLPATEATLLGLRTLRDWSALAEKLPDPTSVLSSQNTSQPQPQLDSLEWQVWQLANGSISLQIIANQLGLAVEKVQQIAFRLLMSNLAEEVLLTAAAPTNAVAEITPIAEDLPEPILDSSSQTDDTQVEPQIIAQTTPIAENLPQPILDSSSQTDDTQVVTHAVAEITPIAENLPQPILDSSSQTDDTQSFLQKLAGYLRVIRSFFHWLFGTQSDKT